MRFGRFFKRTKEQFKLGGNAASGSIPTTTVRQDGWLTTVGLIARKLGGIIGGDEVQISNDGTLTVIESKKGAIKLLVPDTSTSITLVRAGTGNTTGLTINFGTGGQNNSILIPYAGIFGGADNNSGIAFDTSRLRLPESRLITFGTSNNIATTSCGFGYLAPDVMQVVNGALTGGGGLQTANPDAQIYRQQNFGGF